MSSNIDLSFTGSRRVRRRIAAATLTCAIIGVAYGLLTPAWYRSVLTVVPTKSQRGVGGGALSGLLGGDAGALTSGLFDGGAGGADAQRIAAVLQSIAVTDAVVDKFELEKRYGAKYRESARDVLWSHCDVKVLPKPGLVQLSCEDTEPKFVQQLLAYFAEYGNQVFRRIGVSSASEEVRFLEKRVAELRQQADEASARMRAFQEKYKIVDLDTQARAVVSALATLNHEKISKQLELDYARTFSTSQEPAVVQLQSQLSVMDRKVKNLEDAGPGPAPTSPTAPTHGASRAKGANAGMFPPALEVPRLRAELEALIRDRRVAEATLIVALERLEGAKASEARDVSTFLILDPPTLPSRKSRPQRMLVTAILAVLGFAGATLVEAWKAGVVVALLRGPGDAKAKTLDT
jgi:capsule polysaccharide export protein KpsE/RkpR